MRQLVILSGKGGTGKTTLAAAFITFAKARAFADCDVDAPNLHLVDMGFTPYETSPYFALPVAKIDPERCIACGKCEENCRFDAIVKGEPYRVDPMLCEGCGVCRLVCPHDAIHMVPHEAGRMTLYKNGDAVFSTAQLHTGSGTSGLLVSQVKKRMNKVAASDVPFSIVDGSPGIGCPVIATLSGADLALVVTEPTLSGISDLRRIVETARGLEVRVAVCVNKADINPKRTEEIKRLCALEGLLFLGTIPYDPLAVKALNKGLSIAEIPCPSGKAALAVWQNILPLMQPPKGASEPLTQTGTNNQ